MTDPRLQPLLDAIAANIAAAVLTELRTGIPNENADESGQEQRRRGERAHAIYHDDEQAA